MGGRLCAFATTSRVRANCERQELDRRLHDRPAKMASFLGIIEAITKLSIANEADRRPSGCYGACDRGFSWRSEEHTSELQSLMRISYAVFCLKKKKNTHRQYFSLHQPPKIPI